MTYTYEEITEIRLKAQCCFAVLMHNVSIAGQTGNPCIDKLKLQTAMLDYYMDALCRYYPEGYEFTTDGVVFYTQLEEDMCLTNDDIQWIIEGVRGICQCADCLDINELLKDI